MSLIKLYLITIIFSQKGCIDNIETAPNEVYGLSTADDIETRPSELYEVIKKNQKSTSVVFHHRSEILSDSDGIPVYEYVN